MVISASRRTDIPALYSGRRIRRYDPIMISADYPVNWHEETFADLAEKLSGHTEKCVISFVDIYANHSPDTVKKNMEKYDLKEFLLCGSLRTEDDIHIRTVKSLKDIEIQLRLNLGNIVNQLK